MQLAHVKELENKYVLGTYARYDVLVDRVRSRLGRIPVHIGAFDITAKDGVVTLRGQILADEVPKVLRAARFVRGVKDIDNRVRVERHGQSAGQSASGRSTTGFGGSDEDSRYASSQSGSSAPSSTSKNRKE